MTADAETPVPSPPHATTGDDASSVSGHPAPSVVDLVSSVLAVAAVSLAGWQWESIFADLGFVVPMVLGSALASVVALLAARSAWSRPASFLVAAAGTGATLTAFYASKVADLPGDLISSWKGLASTGLLIPTEPRFVLVPTVVAAVGTWLAADRLARGRSSAPAILPIMAVHGVAMAYSVSQRQPPAWYVALLIMFVGGVLAADGLSRPGGAEFAAGVTTPSGRQLGSAMLAVAALAAVGVGFSTLSDDDADAAFDLRERLTRPIEITESATPLARVKAGLVDAGNDTVFAIRLDGLAADEEVSLLPVAVLDRYDGSIWTTTTTFEVAGALLPPPKLIEPTGSVVKQTVTLTEQYPFRFLPRAGVVRSITEGDLAWDPIAGTLAAIDPTDRSYGGEVALVTPDESAPDEAGHNPGSVGTFAQPADLNDEQRRALNAYLAEVLSVDDDPLVQLQTISDDLRSERFGYNIDAPAGHSLAALISYLTPESGDQAIGAAPGRVGFAEHSAATFAVLARQLGVPSRVVVGYRLEKALTANEPERLVGENMIHTWPEVWVAELGWVRFEPTNKDNQTPDQAARTPAVSSSGVDAASSDLPDLREPVLLAQQSPPAGRSIFRWLAALAALPLLYSAIIIGGKKLRRSRRRAKDTDRSVVGAWRETRDRLGELGLPSSSSLSAVDMAEELDLIDRREIAHPLVELAPCLDVALYSPTAATEADVDLAWNVSGTAVREAKRASSRPQRARALLDPRPLTRR